MFFKKQKGIAVIEFTLVLPILVLIIFLTVEFGRLLFQYSELTRMARSAGRFISNTAIVNTTGNLPAVLSDTNCDFCISNMKRVLLSGDTLNTSSNLTGLTASNISVVEFPADSGILVVNVSYDWTPLFAEKLQTFSFGEDIDLSFNLNASYAVTAL
ncbi:pilus assembly protein [Shewanella marinintestina]|uniref:TadE family protein n=1 Tax=Shewanella marinintestina TaxID=190305 RepID=UPI00201055E2|nr:TadE/TadG family type IV pilus assembly protein [Shewanella marinintestina]MCL1144559.1 pilus assembly protein [Shewanella marinintestina]